MCGNNKENYRLSVPRDNFNEATTPTVGAINAAPSTHSMLPVNNEHAIRHQRPQSGINFLTQIELKSWKEKQRRLD